MNLTASYSKGQMKIQQMAFVLVATLIFFVMVALFYFSIQMRTIRQEATTLESERASADVAKLSSTAEFAWKAGISAREDCPNCIDLDKALALKFLGGYNSLWKFDYLTIRKTYPFTNETIECTLANYPNCNTITIVSKKVGTPASAIVPLCRWINEANGYRKCDIGIIIATGEGIG